MNDLKRSSAVSLVAAVMVVVSAPALAAPPPPSPGVECGCSKVGAYLLPAPASSPLKANALTTLSPGGRFSVDAVPTPTFPQVASITVTRVADGAVVLSGQAASDWGFSPDDDRFLLATRTFGGAPATISLYDLSVVPGVRLAQLQPSTVGSAVSFSPHGTWLVDLELASATFADLRILDARTGAQAFADAFGFTSSPGMPGDQLGAVRLGFGPDRADRTLTYASVTGQLSTQWTAVNLQTAVPVANQALGAGFSWGFSPCGDAIGVVADSLDPATALQNAELRATLAPGLLGGFGPFPATETTALSVTAASHRLLHAVTFEVLAPNTAAAACPAPPPNQLPVAAFSAPATAFALLPVQFNDSSHDSDGQVVSWAWEFGDGATAALRSPTHVYAGGQAVTVKLTVTDDRGGIGTVTHPLAVAINRPPDAGFTFAPDPPARRQQVTFTDTSTDDDGVVSRAWNIDGIDLSGLVVSAKACPPSMQVTLNVADHAGQSGSISVEIPVDGGSSEVPVPAGADLATAIAGACAGDTLVLAPGHYTGGVTLPDRVSLRGAGKGVTFIDGWGSASLPWVLQARTDLTIADVTLSDGGTADGVGQQDLAGGGLRLLGGRPQAGVTRVSRVEVAGNVGGGGIWIEDSYGNPVELLGSSVHHNHRDLPGGGGSGLDMFCCAAVTVDHTEFTANTGSAASAAVVLWEATRVVFTNNHVHHNQGWALEAESLPSSFRPRGDVSLNRFVANGQGVRLAGTLEFAGNLVADHGGLGVQIARAGVTVINSTIAGNGLDGLVAPDATVWNTIVAGNGSDDEGAPGVGGGNLIGGAPGFVDADAGDYHLAPGSPAIDQGDPTGVPASLTLDGDGDPRVLNAGSGTARVDIGWDEATTGWLPSSADGGTPDAGADGGVDAGTDAGADGGTDAGPDGGPGAGADGGPATGTDGGTDAGTDGGTGLDAGTMPDAGPGPGDPGTGCGCNAASPGAGLLPLLGAVWVLGRRRRAWRSR